MMLGHKEYMIHVEIFSSSSNMRIESLRYPDFRVLGLANLFNAFAFNGEQVALGWFVLELTDSPFMVALIVGVRMSPMFLFGILAGSAADVLNRRHFIRLLNIAMA